MVNDKSYSNEIKIILFGFYIGIGFELGSQIIWGTVDTLKIFLGIGLG